MDVNGGSRVDGIDLEEVWSCISLDKVIRKPTCIYAKLEPSIADCVAPSMLIIVTIDDCILTEENLQLVDSESSLATAGHSFERVPL